MELNKIIGNAGYSQHWLRSRHELTESDHILQMEMMSLSIKERSAWAYHDVSRGMLPVELVSEARML